LLDQLRQLGFAKQDEYSRRYEVGPAFFALAAMVHSRDTLWQAAEPIVRRLSAHFNETCYLAVREGAEIVFRERVDSTHTLRYIIRAGERAPLHAGAGGRAVLMTLTAEEVRRALQSAHIGALTSHTIVDIDRLVEQARADAARGYAVSHGERVRGGSGIAAPFFDASGRCGGSLVFTSPEQRFDASREPEVSEAVIAASYELSERLGAFPATGALPLLLQGVDEAAPPP
jgi:DNA-binding IclR family transcriptional regulator